MKWLVDRIMVVVIAKGNCVSNQKYHLGSVSGVEIYRYISGNNTGRKSLLDFMFPLNAWREKRPENPETRTKQFWTGISDGNRCNGNQRSSMRPSAHTGTLNSLTKAHLLPLSTEEVYENWACQDLEQCFNIQKCYKWKKGRNIFWNI